ncbi:ZYBA0S03-11342g1_1 [Zygosaccharomyces bailii CLIB 213]|uniref:ZYBA0S03-11342g1_1 n=1 Tax=Zygosaccharomyces bailii (strain CLIB 213 / ATCC 58445 / CBS 680 / BCRC 21525 / NBRC 1098 / NCYC 1416 / NRRL Y-2227) TaxID=1333698 RepID=A0A8J2T6S1_ZYGB2|nr:ZYBA0S03-11342g1_1 [Zygosaccharomyces bailii CLIB 213]
MERFSDLNIDDEVDKTIRDEDLIKLSNLSISDEVNKVPPQIFTKFMPHSPVRPSPLRHSVLLDPHGDKMDVDELPEPIAEVEMDAILVQRSHGTIDSGGMGNEESKLQGEQNSSARTEEVEEEAAEIEDPEEKDDGEGVNKKAVIRALLSPTSLGVAAAAKAEGIPIEPVKDQKLQEGELKQGDSHVTGIDFTSLKDDLRQRSKTQPIHVSINHHHYYPNSDRFYPSTCDWQRSEDGEDIYKLPVPWSAKCKPVSKGAYTFVSYLQLFLDFFTVVVIFSFVTSLVRSLKSDIISSWNHRRLELEYESIACRNLYTTNECILGDKPALQQQCQQWEQCMNRDNDVLFRARTTLGAQMFGEVINSFVEPIGWKALIVVMLGLAIWCFSSNFLLGYMRAKSYYGDATQQFLMQQRRQLFLKNEAPDGKNLLSNET